MGPHFGIHPKLDRNGGMAIFSLLILNEITFLSLGLYSSLYLISEHDSKMRKFMHKFLVPFPSPLETKQIKERKVDSFSSLISSLFPNTWGKHIFILLFHYYFLSLTLFFSLFPLQPNTAFIKNKMRFLTFFQSSRRLL